MGFKFSTRIDNEIRRVVLEIQSHRNQRGMTQEEFAEELGISYEGLKKIEQGSRHPSLKMLFHIALKLGLRVTLSQ